MCKEINKVFINNKTGNKYTILYVATNATNKHDGEKYVVYKSLTQVFVREANEFYNKFSAC